MRPIVVATLSPIARFDEEVQRSIRGARRLDSSRNPRRQVRAEQLKAVDR